MSNESKDHDEFAKRISRPLQAVETVDESFEARVMLGLRDAAFDRANPHAMHARSWWKRARTVRLTHGGMVALAAGLVLLVAGAGTLARRTASESRQLTAAVAPDTVHLVRFVFVDSSARDIMLVGTFNQWEKSATPMIPGSVPGVWFVDVPLSDGRHEYAFIVRDGTGERWVADPLNAAHRDDFGTETSIISLRTSPTAPGA